MKTRLLCLVLAMVTVPFGLATRIVKTTYPRLGDIAGDALYATMVFFLAGVVFPRWSVLHRAALAFAFCAVVELSQLYHRPWIDRIRRDAFMRMLLGTTFGIEDLFCYAAGVLVGAVVLLGIGRRFRRSAA